MNDDSGYPHDSGNPHTAMEKNHLMDVFSIDTSI